MSRWRQGEADIEQLLATRELQPATGSAANGEPGLKRARLTLASAETLLATDPASAFVLAYDATRQACTALLAHQGLRPTTSGGHVAVERAVRAQFGTTFAPYGGLRRRRNEVEYPAHAGEQVDLGEHRDRKARGNHLNRVRETAPRLPGLRRLTTPLVQ